MKTEIKTIEGINCYEQDGMAYLKLEDVARGLGFTKTETKNGVVYESVRWARIESFMNDIGFAHSWSKDSFIPENIFYRLAMKAKNNVAEEFQAKVADEIIPTIRKTGGYVANDELFVNTYLSGADDTTKLLFKGTLEAVRKMNAENDKLKLENAQKTQIIGELQPKADYCDEILKSKNLVTVTQIAKDYGMAASVLNEMLHKFGVQFKQNNQWLLYSKYHNCGYTKSVTASFDRHGETDSQMYTKWTQKGRLFLYEELKKHGVYPLIERNEVSA